MNHKVKESVTSVRQKDGSSGKVVEECASDLNDNRPRLNKILSDKNVTRVVVKHKDRLSRFGFNYIKLLFHGEIVVINETDEKENELVEDLVSIITSFCARIYGNRRPKRLSRS